MEAPLFLMQVDSLVRLLIFDVTAQVLLNQDLEMLVT